MINTLNTLGLGVENVNPGNFKTNINTNTDISVLFNSDLNIVSIIDNFIVLKDSSFKYDSGEIKVSDFETVEGNITYKDKTVFFTPFNQLDSNCRYIIYIAKNGIIDVLGNTMLVDYISYFSTEAYASLGDCKVVYPENNKTLSILDRISLSELNTEKYLIQISKIKTFDNLVVERIINTNLLEEDLKLGDGLYYIRAKALNGVFGDSCVVTIRTHSNTIPTDQDLDESYIWQEYEDNKCSLKETFPIDLAFNINEKTNVIYMKFDGIIDIDNIDFHEGYFIGESNDDDDDDVSSHGDVDGTYTVVHDEEKVETYIFFTPNSL